jgi:hypothetical protein
MKKTEVQLKDLINFVTEQWNQVTNPNRPRALGEEAGSLVESLARQYIDAHRKRDMLSIAAKLGMEVELPDAEALALRETVENLPELIGQRPLRPSAVTPRAQDLPLWPLGEDGEPFVPRFPRLWRMLGESNKPLVLVGGVPVEAKKRWVQELFGLKPNTPAADRLIYWLGTEDESAGKTCDRVVNQMKSGTVGAVVFFVDFMSHAQTRPLIAAGDEYGVPAAAGGKAGQAALLAAFDQLEQQLRARSEKAA